MDPRVSSGSRSSILGRVAIVVAILGIFVNFAVATYVPSKTLEESQQAFDERIAQLNRHIVAPARQETVAFKKQLAIETGAAIHLSHITGLDSLDPVHEVLFGDKASGEPGGPSPEERAEALANPILQPLLEAWVSQTTRPLYEPVTIEQLRELQRFTDQALADANYRADPEDVALFAGRNLDLIETVNTLRLSGTLAATASMLHDFHWTLRGEAKLHLSDEARARLRERVLALKNELSSAQEAQARLTAAHLKGHRARLARLDRRERSKAVQNLSKADRWSAAMLVGSGGESWAASREIMGQLYTEQRALPKEVRLYTLGFTDTWEAFREGRDSILGICLRLEQP